MVSESRYGIVSDLTRRKLSIMDSILELETEIDNKSNEISLKKDEARVWKDRELAEINRGEVEKEQAIKVLEKEKTHLENVKDDKIKSCNEKIVQIDDALKTITEISKSSSIEARQWSAIKLT